VPRVTVHGTKMVTAMVIRSAFQLWLYVSRNCSGCTVLFVAHTGTGTGTAVYAVYYFPHMLIFHFQLFLVTFSFLMSLFPD